jgi:hypothetical protein
VTMLFMELASSVDECGGPATHVSQWPARPELWIRK